MSATAWVGFSMREEKAWDYGLLNPLPYAHMKSVKIIDKSLFMASEKITVDI